jgi:hypothetical protein
MIEVIIQAAAAAGAAAADDDDDYNDDLLINPDLEVLWTLQKSCVNRFQSSIQYSSGQTLCITRFVREC